MKLYKLPEILLVLNFIVFQIVVTPVASSLSYENKNFAKIKQDPTRYQQASAYRNKKNPFATRYLHNSTSTRESNNIHAYVTPRFAPLGISGNYSKDRNIFRHNNNNQAVPRANQYKKWQVGRVSRKQYEIINMLWRKTKIFADVESTTANNNVRPSNETEKHMGSLSALRQPFIRLPSRSNLPSTTPSYIEFYYLDETDERIKELSSPKYITQNPKRIREQIRNIGNFRFILADSPMLAFHIDDPNFKRTAIPTRYMQPTNRMKRRRTRTHDASLTGYDPLISTPSYKYPRKSTEHNKVIIKSTSKSNKSSDFNMTKTLPTSESDNDNATCPITTVALTTENYTAESKNISNQTINVTHIITKSTTAYDRIKFFEIYDQQTPIPYYDERGKLIHMDNDDIFVKGNELYSDRKILLEHIDQSIGNEHSNPIKTKHAKKHIVNNYNSDSKDQSNDNSVVTQIINKPVTFNVSKEGNVTKPLMKLLMPDLKCTSLVNCKKSKHADWSEYSFVAAYVYEPLQVHCDAAGISPHWLVTSGSCLSRHHKNPGGEGRSAFVTYCGETWWNPERMAYVKYSVVHPDFHPRDKTRRHLYNIGLVQVVTSMASACYGWSPIPLMSHQFIADVEGSIANAIGWGLDRFDTRYSSSELPKSLLMSYESQVFSDSCPGNVGYSTAKRLDEEGGIKNVYCLSLPPYSGEETDPVHGALLLVGGKLVALYLQEERRPWGDQSAQYTGTWRLVPWVVDIARENEEVDNFTLDF